MALSLPLVLSAGFLTVQLFLDRVFLTWKSNDNSAASMPAVMLFSTLFGVLQHTVQYASVFVSQYIGAKRPERVGPVLWQAMRVAVVGGLLFLTLVPVAHPLFAVLGHAPEVAALEADYFAALCFAVLPSLVVGVINAFYSGLGRTWTVLAINAVGLAVNAPLAYGWILGEWGFPELGAAGAGYATVCGAVSSMLFGLALLLRRRYEAEFRTRSGWRFDATLMKRLLRFGLPNGLVQLVDMTAWTAFVFLVGVMSKVEGAATNVAFTINLIAFLPLMGLGQAVEILVGRHQGEKQPDLSARTTITGVKLALGYALGVSVLYALLPGVFTGLFGLKADAQEWAKVEPVVRTLLLFVALYTCGDAVNVIVSYALRGAGDTRFVAVVAVVVAWPVMVIPTWAAIKFGWGVYGAWWSATAYIFVLAAVFTVRFRGGKWRGMTVIEATVVDTETSPPVPLFRGRGGVQDPHPPDPSADAR